MDSQHVLSFRGLGEFKGHFFDSVIFFSTLIVTILNFPFNSVTSGNFPRHQTAYDSREAIKLT